MRFQYDLKILAEFPHLCGGVISADTLQGGDTPETKRGDIPSINRLVDIGNLVSIRYALPVAVFDLRDVTGDVTVRYANGDERFQELGSSEVKHPEAHSAHRVINGCRELVRKICKK